MSTRLNPLRLPKSIRKGDNTYYKAAKTKDNIYYVAYSEGDENTQTLMYDSEGKLVSDNYHATLDLLEVVQRKTYTWLSKTMKSNAREINKDENNSNS